MIAVQFLNIKKNHRKFDLNFRSEKLHGLPGITNNITSNGYHVMEDTLNEIITKNEVNQTPTTFQPIENIVTLFVKSYLARNTKIAYAKDVAQFFDYCKGVGHSFSHPNEMQSYHLAEYRDFLINTSKLEANSVLRKLVAVRALMRWCCNEGIVDRNTFLNVQLPRSNQVSSTQDFTDTEVKKILSLPPNWLPSGSLHYLVLVLLFYLGLRKSELIAIKLKNFYEQGAHRVLQIHGKGSKVRQIPLTPLITSAISNYISITGKVLTPDDYLLRPVRNNSSGNIEKQIHISTVDWIVIHYTNKAGIKKKVSPHSCRATVVGHLLEQKTPIRDVANMLGHSSIQTTSLYDKRKNDLDKSAAYKVHF